MVTCCAIFVYTFSILLQCWNFNGIDLLSLQHLWSLQKQKRNMQLMLLSTFLIAMLCFSTTAQIQFPSNYLKMYWLIQGKCPHFFIWGGLHPDFYNHFCLLSGLCRCWRFWCRGILWSDIQTSQITSLWFTRTNLCGIWEAWRSLRCWEIFKHVEIYC